MIDASDPTYEKQTDTLSQRYGVAAAIVAAVKDGRSLNTAFDVLKPHPANFRSSVQDMVYSTLRRYGRGEFQLSCLMEKPLNEKEVHALLLVALARLDQTPDLAHTIVDQAVDRASFLASGVYRGLVNGVLRNFLRRRQQIDEQIAEHPVARYCYPEWWLTSLQNTFPEDWQSIAEVGNTHPPMALRINRRKTTPESYLALLQKNEVKAQLESPDGVLLEKPVPVGALPGFFDGLVSVQDLGAQMAAHLLDAQEGHRVLDACAAPGGKTAHILELASVDLLALDNEEGRRKKIDETLSRLGLTAKTMTMDCRLVTNWWDGKPFDRILADVPCSASGVVRRHADIRWLRRQNDIRSMATLQRQILKTLWPLLAPGGKFLYATCSLFPEENGEQISAFLAHHSDAYCLEARQLLPNGKHDGFYYAVMQKNC